VFVSQASVVEYFGAKAKKWAAYLVASVSGFILAVCSCTVLSLFPSIHKRGAGLGPAIAFLYSGQTINILVIILTARILGMEFGIARIVGAVLFGIIIGLALFASLIFILKLDKIWVTLGTVVVLGLSFVFDDTPLIPHVATIAILTLLLSFAKEEPNQWLGKS